MRYFILLAGMVLVLATLASGETYVVNPEGTGDFPTIQAAIDSVLAGDIIELTDGTFTGDGNRDMDYLGKAITIRSQSGDPDLCIIDCEGSEPDPHRGFTFQSGEDSGSILEGVTITHGYAYGAIGSDGGGITCLSSSSPTFTNCTFSGNSSGFMGGGMSVTVYSCPTLTECTFSGNSGGLYGGAVSCYSSAEATLIDCMFSGNWAASSGGAMVVASMASATLTDCTFSGNWCIDGAGGAVIVGNNASSAFTNCMFSDNSADTGGAIELSVSSQGTVTGCTFSGNAADLRGGGINCVNSFATIAACTFHGNSAPGGNTFYFANGGQGTLDNTIVAFGVEGEAFFGDQTPTLTCCDVYGSPGGPGTVAGQIGTNGNIAEDPLFCDPENENFYLMDISPCAPFSPPNPECDLIGAWPVGCGQDIVEHAAFPIRLYLAPSSPNPFSQATGITYRIPGDLAGSRVLLTVFDPTGRLVRSIVDARQQPGRHSITWDATDQAGRPVEGGVYFYRLSVGGETVTKRMLLIR